jgi:hypothetical protein
VLRDGPEALPDLIRSLVERVNRLERGENLNRGTASMKAVRVGNVSLEQYPPWPADPTHLRMKDETTGDYCDLPIPCPPPVPPPCIYQMPPFVISGDLAPSMATSSYFPDVHVLLTEARIFLRTKIGTPGDLNIVLTTQSGASTTLVLPNSDTGVRHDYPISIDVPAGEWMMLALDSAVPAGLSFLTVEFAATCFEDT